MKTIALSGGHLSPAVAIAEEFKKRGWNVVVFGRAYAFSQAKNKSSLEKEMFKEMEIDFRAVDIPRFPQSAFAGASYILPFLSSAASIAKSLKEIKPEAVMSFGGYVSIPLLAAAAFLKIPIFLHEQTVTAGLSNKIFDFFAQKVFTSWDETTKTFPQAIQNKIILTGNPIRGEILSIKPKSKRKKDLTVYITGGSTGAHAINLVVASCLEKLLKKFTVIHQAGDSHYDDFEMLTKKRNELPQDLQKKYQLVRYVNLSEVKKTYEATDIVVGRSGANTVTEVALLGKPSVFIPLPLAQYNEQELLAQKLHNHGVALIINQEDLTAEALLGSLENIARNYETYVKHGKTYRESEEITRHKDAHRRIADTIESWDDRRRYSTS